MLQEELTPHEALLCVYLMWLEDLRAKRWVILWIKHKPEAENIAFLNFNHNISGHKNTKTSY